MRADVLANHVALILRGLVAPLQARNAELEDTTAALVKANADLKTRVDYLEARPVTVGLRYQKTWSPGTAYEPGDVVTHGGSGWVCDEATTAKPGESKAWTLFVKRGKDGKDGKDAA